MPTLEGMDEAPARALRPIGLRQSQPLWIRQPIAEAKLLTLGRVMPRYCEALRCQGKRRAATTFHAVIGVRGEPTLPGWPARTAPA